MTGPEAAVRAGCHACAGRWPDPEDHVADLAESRAYLHTDQHFPGWTVLVLRRHAVELFELEAGERARLMDDVSATAAALRDAFGARKVNYALFGNRLPHIHWHVIPRLAGDPAPTEAPFAVPHEPVRLGPAARAERIARIRERLRR